MRINERIGGKWEFYIAFLWFERGFVFAFCFFASFAFWDAARGSNSGGYGIGIRLHFVFTFPLDVLLNYELCPALVS